MKKLYNYLPLLVFLALAFFYFVSKTYFDFPKNRNAASREKLNLLVDIISNEYVDEINIDSIVTITANSILEKLDPHSIYIPSNEFESISENMRGDFVGIGVNFFIHNDTIAILKAIEGGPSHRAGIQSGDRIMMADNDILYGKNISSDQVVNRLKGEEDSNVLLKIFRKSTQKTFEIPLKRGVVSIKSVDNSSLITNKIGYIKINRFSETTYNEFIAHLNRLMERNIESLIIDLRDNSGGYMDEAIKIADELLSNNQLIVYTKDRKNKTEKTFATSKGTFEKKPVFILINENSASASEILAGAVQDNDRGTIIGRRSFGKGLVQKDKALGDGSVVRLTIARYYTPTGRSIQKPYSNSTEAYFNEFYKRFESGELNSKDSIVIDDSLKFKTPKGKIVYGGGGITPDIFVPIEEKVNENELFYVSSSDYISRYVFTVLDENRNQFKPLTVQKFISQTAKEDTLFSDFEDYIETKKIPINTQSNAAYFKKSLIAEFIRQLYGDKAYFNYMLINDPMIKKVMNQNDPN